MTRRIRDHIHHHIVGYVALAVVLSAAPAYAASIGSSDIARNAVLSRHIKAGNVTTSDIADNAVDRTKLGAGSVGSGQVRANSLTGADINEGSLGKVPLAAQAETVANSRVALVEGDISGRLILQRGDWRVSATCVDDPNSVFPIGNLRLDYLHADDGTRASALRVDGSTVFLHGASGAGDPGTWTDVLSSGAALSGGTFFATDGASGIQGLASVRIPSHDGAYVGDNVCQFDVVVLG